MSFRTWMLGGAAALGLVAAAPAGAQTQPVTGLYIAAAGGLNWVQGTEIEAEGAFSSTLVGAGIRRTGKASFELGYGVVVSVGFGFGNGLRAEIEGNWRQNDVDSIGGFAPLGPFRSVTGRQQSYGVMANVLYDVVLPYFGVAFPWVQPYVGVGVGYVWTEWDNVRAVSPLGFALRADDTDGRFAYQGILGAAFPILSVPGLAITAEYRFLGTLSPRMDARVTDLVTGASVGGRTEIDNFNHSAFIGVRYAFNQPRPAPAVVTTPPATAARSYLVFFDFDRADLTERARGIISEAANNARRGGTSRIEVAGHADRSGTPQYNQGLSQRRANNVAAELVRNGVRREDISVAAFGESRPLVPTADGVREPQNRRVEIVLR
jgi:outer membrane protein OmpA-like peptidoglycan-associated protein